MGSSSAELRQGKPPWLKTPLPGGGVYQKVRRQVHGRKLVTVCEEAKCPNIGSCWSTGTATFMVLGDVCTRACRFCHIKTGDPGGWLDGDEPRRVADSVEVMGLKYVVLTMVDRDDLSDGGALHVAQVVCAIKEKTPHVLVEVLAGDFAGDFSAIDQVLQAGVVVYAHNVETVERLSPRVRDGRAHYSTSLEILKQAKERGGSSLLTKSAVMVGLGESEEEVYRTLEDLRLVHCDLVTLGQYMRPTKKHLAVKEWVHPEVFERYAEKARNLGFLAVASHPLVRSSYKAHDLYSKAQRSVSCFKESG